MTIPQATRILWCIVYGMLGAALGMLCIFLQGDRGIKVCDKWANSFEAFLEDMGEKPKGLTLERIDVNDGYYPENCTWATIKDQANNRTSNRILTHNGKSMTAAQWAEHLEISYPMLRMRLHRGWSTKRALGL